MQLIGLNESDSICYPKADSQTITQKVYVLLEENIRNFQAEIRLDAMIGSWSVADRRRVYKAYNAGSFRSTFESVKKMHRMILDVQERHKLHPKLFCDIVSKTFTRYIEY